MGNSVNRSIRIFWLIVGFWIPGILFGENVNSVPDSLVFGHIEVHSDVVAENLFEQVTDEFAEVPASSENYQELSQSLLKIPASQGYYFPALQMESVHPQIYSGLMNLNPVFRLNWGETTRIDTILFTGVQNTRPAVLHRIIDPFTGLQYTPQTDREIKRSLRRFPFLTMSSPAEIIKTRKGKTGILLSVTELRENEFTGVAGYVPETYNSKGYFTGELDLKLHNLSGTGRQMLLYWSKTNQYSQQISLNYTEPWIWKTNLFGSLSFEQVLRDTLVVIRKISIGSGYYSVKLGSIELSLNRESTIPTPGARVLLGLVNTRTDAIGLNYTVDRRDNFYNPVRGYLVNSSLSMGVQKRDSLANAVSSNVSFRMDTFYPLKRQLVLAAKFNARGKWLSGTDPAYSDQFWFGGAGTLRGYPNDFFRGSRIVWSSLELRRLIGNLSSFFIFFDQGYYWRKDDNRTVSAYPSGYGFGIRLASRMGIIGLDYGFGEGDTFSTAKVHIRLISRF